METSRGECPLNSCQVQVVLGAPPHATRPSVSPSQSAAAPEGRGYNGQHSGIRNAFLLKKKIIFIYLAAPGL